MSVHQCVSAIQEQSLSAAERHFVSLQLCWYFQMQNHEPGRVYYELAT